MIPLSLDVIEPLGRVIARPWADVVTGMQVDSRRIDEGDLFVAVGGGEDFVEHAFARGASAALVPTDAFAALAAVAAAVRERSQARVVGITGSTGKTSTKDILFALCAPERRTIANEGNYNTEIGVPLTLCRIEEDTEICISELAMRGLGQIAWLASFVRPDVGGDHERRPRSPRARPDDRERRAREGGGARRRCRREERRSCPRSRCSSRISPARTSRSGGSTKRRRSRFGRATRPPISSRTRARRSRPQRCSGFPLPEDELTVEFSKLREEERELPGGVLLLNDCYNANPVSMRAALLHLVERGNGRRLVAVLGEMAELGDEAARVPPGDRSLAAPSSGSPT